MVMVGMTKKRFTTDNGSHEDVCLVDNLTKKEYESNFEDMVSLMNDIWNQTQRFEKHNQRLEKENEQLKNELEKLSYANEDLLEEKRIWKQMSDEYTKLSYENEQLNLLSNLRGEMVSFATSLIQDMGSEEMLKMWNDFKEVMYQKWSCKND